jgi:hypothetical protein
MGIIDTILDGMKNNVLNWYGHVVDIGGSRWPFDLVAGRKKDEWKNRKEMGKGNEKREKAEGSYT